MIVALFAKFLKTCHLVYTQNQVPLSWHCNLQQPDKKPVKSLILNTLNFKLHTDHSVVSSIYFCDNKAKHTNGRRLPGMLGKSWCSLWYPTLKVM